MEYDQFTRGAVRPLAVFAVSLLLMFPVMQVGAGDGIVKPVDVVPAVRAQGDVRAAGGVRADVPNQSGAWTRIQQRDSQCSVQESRAMRHDMSRPKGGAAIAVSARNSAAAVGQAAVWQRLEHCSPRLNLDRQKLLVLLAVWRGLA